MAKLRIPRGAETGLIKLKALDEESFQRLLSVLGEIPPVFQQEHLVACVTQEMSSVPKADLDDILETVLSLYGAQTRLDVSMTELAGHICTAMEESDTEQLRLAGRQCDDFKARLMSLLSIDSLTYPAKAAGLATDYERIFVYGRIVTDMRAVFGPDTEDLPRGAAIVHVLNMTYQQSGEIKNFHIAMDSEDVESLITTLQRAQSKEKGLKKLLAAAEVTCVVPE